MENTPVYTFSEAARYLKIPVATLRSWAVGRVYPTRRGSARFEPLIEPSVVGQPLLSFNDLVQSYVLRSLRQEHGVSVDAFRKARDYAQSECNIPKLLLSDELRTTAGDLFLERYGQLINLSRSGQLALRKVLEAHLERIEWREALPVRLHPFISYDQRKLISIDPFIGFGRPFITRKGVSTAIIVDRIDAGEQPEDIGHDYDLEQDEVDIAVVYELAA